MSTEIRIPTLFCINQTYAQHAAVCIVSLLENNRDLRFEIVVVSTNPLGAAEEKLHQTIERYRNCSLRIAQFDKAKFIALPLRGHYSLDTYVRLWMAEFFPADVDRILYLDSDVVVVGSIGELWRTDIRDSILGAVTIPGSTRCESCGVPEEFGYFQAGVLIINLKRWRDSDIPSILLRWINQNYEKIVDVDQDVLNACLYDRRHALPYIWNVIVPFYFNYHPLRIPNSEIRAARKNAHIIHFNGPSKPWQYLNRHPRRAEYWKYLKLTEWRDYVPPDKSVVNWGKRTMGPFIPDHIRRLLKRAQSVRQTKML